MIQQIYGRFVVTCDICDEILGYYNSFEEARTAVAEAGWSTQKVNSEWTNWCNECQEQDK